MVHEHSHASHAEHSHSTPDEPATPGSHQATVLATFDSYLRQSISSNQRRRRDFLRLSSFQRGLVPDYLSLLSKVDDALIRNARFVHKIAESNAYPPPDDAALSAPAPTEADHDRLRSTLRQFSRDWSSGGKPERDVTYGPILEALEAQYQGVSPKDRTALRVLVPGAGLGRLAWEIVRAGFSCQANEFSLYMLMAASFILNDVTKPNEFLLHPFVHTLSNVRSSSDLLASISIPDVFPSEISGGLPDFSFAAGDFLEVYGNEEGTWDAVCTCFFIDTAKNIFDYLERIYAILKIGGVWINMGPLLWHFENTEGVSSIELTLEDVKLAATKLGFKISNEAEIQTSYTSNPHSMLSSHYTASFFVCTKV